MSWIGNLPAPDGQGARRLLAQREASGVDRVPSSLMGLYVDCMCMTELGLSFKCSRQAEGIRWNRSWFELVLAEERPSLREVWSRMNT